MLFPGKQTNRDVSSLRYERKNMGDRSPKSNQKKSNQKDSKATASNQKKQQAVANKQAAGKKK